MSEISYTAVTLADEDKEIPLIRELMTKELSEPYTLYVYRYFMYSCPDLTIMAHDGNTLVGAIVCNISSHKDRRQRGYIAMIAVCDEYRGRHIGSKLVAAAVTAMKAQGADEVVLETETVNKAAIRLYENLGFLRSKRLYKYYLNSNDAFRLILPLTEKSTMLTRMMVE
ncbi:uncharacterized protein SAPINGB_P001618 [Magnusiomyces paraingens]|uniref:N-acetyltransferase domain-containing protein n=1 Tax=Magnusiomyces paraingens TaxID=2606893 RepID=A0A5E8BCR3_9ASCO|nr:uncharacterized protein SAPINGB_P001618 [Saprochaete ingens]VVT47251.1 unnamed protein product [Saprochaete ingens]